MVKAADITDEAFMEALDPTGRPTMLWELSERLNMPWKVVLAKARTMILRRRTVDGCYCGCRGDFQSLTGQRRWYETAKFNDAIIAPRVLEEDLLNALDDVEPHRSERFAKMAAVLDEPVTLTIARAMTARGKAQRKKAARALAARAHLNELASVRVAEFTLARTLTRRPVRGQFPRVRIPDQRPSTPAQEIADRIKRLFG